jgi:PilZ domain-containing protein
VEIPVRIYEEITGLAELPPPVDEADYERRKHRRVPFGHKATITPERKGYDNTPAVVMVRDVSLGGVSFINDDALKVGTPILIEFKGLQERPVKLHCAVVRCEAGGSGGAQFVVGASFDAVLTKELPLEVPSGTSKLAEPAPAEPKHAEAAPVTAKDVQPAAEPKAPVPSMTLTDEAVSAEDQAHIAERLKKPEPAPRAAAPVPASPAPVKSSALFKAADPAEAKKESEAYWSEGEPTEALPQPAAAKAQPELSTPVFRDVPMPEPEPEVELEQKPETISEPEDEPQPEPGSELGTEPEPVTEIPEEKIPEQEIPEKEITVAPEPARQSHDHHGKTHEVLARVKELLVIQEQSIAKQRQELKDQRARFEKELKSMRAELEDTKAKLAEIRTKSDEDEDAIAELETFLKQHDRREPPAKKNEAA